VGNFEIQVERRDHTVAPAGDAVMASATYSGAEGTSLIESVELDTGEAFMATGNLAQRTRRAHYQLSHDRGQTWSAAKPVIDCGSPYDETHWAPGVTFGVEGCIAREQGVFLPDGTLVVPFVVTHPAPPKANRSARDRAIYITTRFAQARYSREGDELDWRFGEAIEIEYPMAVGGAASRPSRG